MRVKLPGEQGRSKSFTLIAGVRLKSDQRISLDGGTNITHHFRNGSIPSEREGLPEGPELTLSGKRARAKGPRTGVSILNISPEK